jgi:hypothetical protein
MKTYTREELTAITPEQFNAMSEEEKSNVKAQGKAFMIADREAQGAV